MELTNTEKLKWLAEDLWLNADFKLDRAVYTLIEALADVGDGRMTIPCGDIGINITKNGIVLVNLNTDEIILNLALVGEVNYGR